MEKTKVINTLLNNKYPAQFTLRYGGDPRKAVLTAPYVKWAEADRPEIQERVYTVSGRELHCIEKNYFDRQVAVIPVRGYPVTVEMPDILEKAVPPHVYNQMFTNTFKIAKNADPAVYAQFLQDYNASIESVKRYAGGQRRCGVNVEPADVLYAKKCAALSDSDTAFTAVLINRKNNYDSYKLQYHVARGGAADKPQSYFQYVTKDLYYAKSYFDTVHAGNIGSLLQQGVVTEIIDTERGGAHVRRGAAAGIKR